jgi:hypothetical protein
MTKYQIRDARPNRGHNPGSFVTEDEEHLEGKITIIAVEIIVY